MKQLLNHFNKSLNAFKIPVRYRNPDLHWAVLKKKKFPTDKALEHFDDFYKSVFDKKWEDIRTALLSKKHKYMAVLNNFSGSEDIKLKMQNAGALDVKIMYDIRKEMLNENKVKERSEKLLNVNLNVEEAFTKSVLEEVNNLYPTGGNISIESLNNDKKSDKEAKNNSSNDNDEDEGFCIVNPNKLDPVQMKSIEYNREITLATERIIMDTAGLSDSNLFEFMPPTKIKGMDDWISDSEHYSFYRKGEDFDVKVEKECNLNFPKYLSLYAFEQESESKFPNPNRGPAEIFDYYLYDGASMLPVLALDIQLNDTVLDMCAAPGGKSLTILQTMYPKLLVVNDISLSRVKRIKKVFNEYLSSLEGWEERLHITHIDARDITDKNVYNKILVDVPCTTDRHSLHEDENNYFHVERVRERLTLPQLQADILINALKLVAPGGTVVYSTCSLSPIQNEGVVQVALKKIWEETESRMLVKDMTEALEPLKYFYDFHPCSYGHLVIPTMMNNWGPMYFCKIQRLL